jgi:hypothetical protein
MKLILLLALLGPVLFAPKLPTSYESLKRSCPGIGGLLPCREYWQNDTVFIGTVKKLVNVPFPTDFDASYHWQKYQKVIATLSVDEVFRGKLGTEVVFEMEDCYFEFVEGETYLIYGNKGADGKIPLKRSRSRTAQLSEAAEDIAYIRSLPNVPPGGRVFGRIRRQPSRTQLTGGASGAEMAGVQISLKNGDKMYQTVSDGTGYYEFTGVHPGTYDLIADLPDHVKGTRAEVRVDDKACSHVSLWVEAHE